jgi:hypothetical protein
MAPVTKGLPCGESDYRSVLISLNGISWRCHDKPAAYVYRLALLSIIEGLPVPLDRPKLNEKGVVKGKSLFDLPEPLFYVHKPVIDGRVFRHNPFD